MNASVVLDRLKGAWRQLVPLVAGIAAVALVAATLPSLPTSNPYVARAGAQNGHGAGAGTAAGGPTPGAAGANGQASGPGGSLTAAGAGGAGALGPTTGCSNGGQTYQGVSCNEIATVFNYQQPGTSCGQDLSGALVALGVANADPVTSLSLLVPFFNSPKAAELFPQFANVLQHGYYGRYIKGIEVPDNGAFCDQQNHDLAVQVATQTKPFFVLGGCLTCGSEGSGDIWQETLPQYGIPSIEDTQNSEGWYQQYAPYDWSLLVSGDTVAREWEAMVCDYLKSRPTSTSPPNAAADPTNQRIFSISHIDLPEENKIGHAIFQAIQACGAKTGIEYAYEKNLSDSAAQAANYNAQMRNSDTTTILNYADAIATLIGSTEDGSTNYVHEDLISGFGFDDTDGITEQYSSNQTPHWFGLGNDNEWEDANVKYCDTWYGKLWCDKFGSKQPPSDYGIWAVDLQLYATMLLMAGPTLTPQSIQHGMFTSCSPCPRVSTVPGQPGTYSPLVGFGPKYPDGEYSGIKDYVPVMWDPNKHSDYVAFTSQSNQHPGQGIFMPWGEPAGSPFAKDFPYNFPSSFARYRVWDQPS